MQSEEASIACLDNTRLQKFPRGELRDVPRAPRPLTNEQSDIAEARVRIGFG
jgi:hypothetical protein